MQEQNNNLPSWNGIKDHTYREIKNFYDKISLFPQDILDQIIFYGGTVFYVAAKCENVDRCFGDLDVLVHPDKLSLIRDYLNSTGDLIIQYDGKKVVDDYHIISEDGIQDFGFKGILYGIKLSVHPIAETSNKEIITKWIKTKDEDIDLIANCTMLQDCELANIITKIEYNNKTLNIIKPEINVGWKMRRMGSHDEQDIKFALENKEILSIEESDIDFFQTKMPNYDVSKAYKIVNERIQELGKGTYEEFY